MKILLTIPNFRTAGSQFVVLNLYHGFKEKGIEVNVLINDSTGHWPEEIAKADRLIIPKNTEVNRFKGLVYSFKFAIILLSAKITIVNSWDYKSEIWEALGCKMANVKYTFTKKNSAWSSRWAYKSKLADKIIFDNPTMGDTFLKPYLQKTVFIPHGIKLSQFQYSPKSIRKLPFVVGVVAVIDANKNHITLLKALKLIKELTIELHFYGQEWPKSRELLEDFAAKNNISNKIKFFGKIPNSNLNAVMQTFDVLVLPSLSEGLPLTILEAMASGTYCIASESGGGTSFLLKGGELGSLFNPMDYKSLSKILKDVYDNQIDKQTLLAARNHVEVNFTVNKEVASYITCFNELLGNKG